MVERQRLSDGEIRDQLSQLSGWELQQGKLHKEFQFANFVEAFGFMASAALIAEKMGHHPEWSNVYNRVVMDLSTHDIGGISSLDFRLAAAIDELRG